jgi:hypothetical protein
VISSNLAKKLLFWEGKNVNKEKLRRMRYAQVKVRPMAQPIDSNGVNIKARDDKWVFTTPFKDVINLYNTVTQQNVQLKFDHVREYMTDIWSSDGILILKSQIFTLRRGAFLEPLQ